MFLFAKFWQVGEMGKRSGSPHRDDELAKLSRTEIEAEIARARMLRRIAPSAKMAKLSDKRIHWLEAELTRRD